MTFTQIKLVGLRELTKQVKELDAEAAKQLKGALDDAAQIVVNVARPNVPSVTGVARASIVVKSTARESRVRVGGPKAPYYPWLDFGGAVGRGKSVRRPYIKGGRYLFPAYERQRANIMRALQKRITAVAANVGLHPDAPSE